MTLPPKFTLRQYIKWIKDPRAREASLTVFFNQGGVERTINILQGDAQQRSINKWRSFGARHYTQFKKNPTRKRAIALRNWGFQVAIP